MELAETERAKYEEVWRNPRYREFSPGERHFLAAFGSLAPQSGESLIDYGCGTGRAAKMFQDRGLVVTGIDHASNCLEVDVPFRQACLWDLPSDLSSDLSYCTDVMEHIPPVYVEAVLDGIATRTRRAAFFAIATTADAFGPKYIGAPLHLTVENADWWTDKLRKRFRDVQVRSTASWATFACRA